MNDEKISVKEAIDKLYDLSWMVGSTWNPVRNISKIYSRK